MVTVQELPADLMVTRFVSGSWGVFTKTKEASPWMWIGTIVQVGNGYKATTSYDRVLLSDPVFQSITDASEYLGKKHNERCLHA